MAIHDPNQNEMERRLLLAMALSMAVLFLVPYLYYKVYPRPTPLPDPPTQTNEEAVPPQVTPPVTVTAPTAPSSPSPATTALARTVEVENEDIILRWTSADVALESVQLKHYPTPTGEPLELIPRDLPPPLRKMLAVRVGDEFLDGRLEAATYEIVGDPGRSIFAPTEIEFRYRDETIEVTRRFRIPTSGYVVEVETEIQSGNRPLTPLLVLGTGIGEIAPTTVGDFANPQVAVYNQGGVTRYTAEDLADESVRFGPGDQWVALDSQFFTCTLFDPAGLGPGTARPRRVPLGDGEEALLVGAEVGLESNRQYVFFGPKDYDLLRAADPNLGNLIDYGWFAFLVQPLLFCLKFIYQYINNYGWAIIILTFVINLALFPVRYKQMVSMKKMSEVQPEMKTIQEKYKRMKRDDPRRENMNKEVMALYKRHGVNPLGGCLPLVIQMPFLFAFYRMLYSSIELRGAPFIGWIQDLSRHDPYYITPVLMGASMVLQQKMTPAVGDPTQRKMMMFLPIVFMFLFLNFSSGLVIYFLFSNLFGMMFQVLLKRWSPELAERKPNKTNKPKK